MFAGTGTTLEATVIEGRLAIGIEADNEYWPDIELRLERAHAAYVVDGVAVPVGASTGAPVAQDADDKLTQAAGSTAANGDSGTSSDRLNLDASASELDSVSPQRGEDAAGASNYEASLVSHCADESGTVGSGAQPGAASPPLVTHEAGDDSDNVYALTDTSALDDRQDAATQGIKEKLRIHLGARGEQSTSEVQARPACNDASGEAAPVEPVTDPEGDGIMPTNFRRKEGWLEMPSLVVTVP